jgi:predicted transcriptional regulator
MMNEKVEQLLEFFKALADANRLKIVGLLAQDEYTVEEMSEILEIRPSTVSHHLTRLAKAGLVSARSESYYNVYKLETRTLEAMSQRILAQETFPAVTADVDLDAYDRKVVNNFCDSDGRVRQFPAQQKKFEAILRYVIQAFEPGKRYSEKEVNEILKNYSDDTATLRRGFIEYKYMQRETGGSQYWLTGED